MNALVVVELDFVEWMILFVELVTVDFRALVDDDNIVCDKPISFQFLSERTASCGFFLLFCFVDSDSLVVAAEKIWFLVSDIDCLGALKFVAIGFVIGFEEFETCEGFFLGKINPFYELFFLNGAYWLENFWVDSLLKWSVWWILLDCLKLGSTTTASKN